jgi:hypothetical protein
VLSVTGSPRSDRCDQEQAVESIAKRFPGRKT